MKNIFYFHHLNQIGGVENMFYELAKKYNNFDITIYYDVGDQKQIDRLKKYVRVKKYQGERIKCEKAFFNYNMNIIDNVDANDYYLIIHADYKAQKIVPYIHPKINKFIGVSQAVCDTFKEITGHDCQLCYNPITIDAPKRVLTLVSATRLTKEKGSHRMEMFAKALDNAGIPYMWYIFTNSKPTIDSPNVVYKQPTLEINDYLQNADYVVQLSDTESYCYTIVESLLLGTPVIVTNWPCLKELGVTEEYGFILPFDMKNIPIQDIYTKKFNFKYEAKQDCWGDILAPGASTYKDEINSTYLVSAKDVYEYYNTKDSGLGRVPNQGDTWEVSYDRLQVLLGNNKNHRQYVDLIKRIPPKKSAK